jgi:phosphoadenosine phosphosulfate reductase
MTGAAVDVERDGLRFRLEVFQRRLETARELVRAWLALCARPYVAFSGGKDSTVTLALAREQRPDIPVIWHDDELEHAETVAFVRDLRARWRLHLIVTQGCGPHGGWFHPWREEPFWRPPLPEMLWIGEKGDRWAWRAGYDGCLLGLRAAEATRRRRYLRARGPLHRTARGWLCHPLAGWSADDVWAAIVGLGLPYNPVYDRLAALGVPRDLQRVGPLPLEPRWELERGWPEEFQRLTQRYGVWRWR